MGHWAVGYELRLFDIIEITAGPGLEKMLCRKTQCVSLQRAHHDASQIAAKTCSFMKGGDLKSIAVLEMGCHESV